MQKLPNVAFIHGSGQSGLSFNYLQVFLPEHNLVELEYQTQEDPQVILKRFDAIIQANFGNEPFSVVAHSYGCLLSALFADRCKNINGIIALSSPWGGSQTAKWLNMVFRQSRLFMNTNPKSAFVQEVQDVCLDIPVTNVVTTGSPGAGNVLAGMGNQHNDGLLTVATQKKIPQGFSNVDTIEVPLSHNEVLMCYDTVNIIKNKFFGGHNGNS